MFPLQNLHIISLQKDLKVEFTC